MSPMDSELSWPGIPDSGYGISINGTRNKEMWTVCGLG